MVTSEKKTTSMVAGGLFLFVVSVYSLALNGRCRFSYTRQALSLDSTSIRFIEPGSKLSTAVAASSNAFA